MEKKLLITPDQKLCIINGKFFPCRFHELYQGIHLTIGETTSKEDNGLDIKDLKNISTYELPINSHLFLERHSTSLRHIDFINIYCRKEGETEICLNVGFLYSEWNHPWNMNHFLSEMKRAAEAGFKDLDKVDINISLGDPGPFINFYFRRKVNSLVVEVITEYVALVEKFYEDAKLVLEQGGHPQFVTAQFNFPLPFRAACEQYLMYFGEFLNDLGIDTSSEITRSGTDVLFRIIPNRKRQALEKIKEALAIYLKLPDVQIDSLEASKQADVQLQILIHKYVSNIRHLQSQLALSQAVVRAQQVQINELERHLEDEISGIFENSLKQVITANSKEERHSFFGGIFRLRTWSKGPIEIDAPKILESVKALLKR